LTQLADPDAPIVSDLEVEVECLLSARLHLTMHVVGGQRVKPASRRSLGDVTEALPHT
jgi:hypothetical protein